jgi:sugar lactone lactonase YvrE
MRARSFAVSVVIVGLALTSAVAAQGPGAGTARTLPFPTQARMPDWQGAGLLHLLQLNTNGSASEAQSSTIPLGQPGLAFSYVGSYGVSEAGYFADGNHLNSPSGVGVDAAGNLWVTEEQGDRALQYTPTGALLTSFGVAGLAGVSDWAHLQYPVDVTVDAQGQVWIVDAGRVGRYDPAGTIVASAWQMAENPMGIAFDTAGNFFVSDASGQCVRVFDRSGVQLATIGEVGVLGWDNSHFAFPARIAIDRDDSLYVADRANQRVQIFDRNHTYVATIGVTQEAGADNQHLSWPSGVAVNGPNIYVADTNNGRVQVFRRDTRSYVRTIGTGAVGSGNYELRWPPDVAADPAGNVYVADSGNRRVQKFDDSGAYVRTFGTTGIPYLTDNYHYNAPYGVAVDASGNIGIVEQAGQRFVKLDASGIPQFAVGQAGVSGTDNAHFSGPSGIAFDANGYAYVAESSYGRVQVFKPDGTYFATLGSYGSGNYQFASASDVAIGSNGYIYVVDTMNHRVQVYDRTRIYLVTLGVSGEEGSDTLHFRRPKGICVDDQGNIYVADTGNHRVLKFDRNRTWQMTLGTTGVSGESFAHFSSPADVAVDSVGRIFVSDTENDRVQVFDHQGAYLTTISGSPGGRVGQLRDPRGIAVDQANNIYIADSTNHCIQKYSAGVPGWTQVSMNGFGDPNNLAVPKLSTFGGALYAGVGNSTTGAEVWRFSGSSWQRVVQGGFGDPSNYGVDSLSEFNGYLYAGTGNSVPGGSNGAQIWRSPTGDAPTWQQVVAGGLGDVQNTEVLALASFAGYLYASTTRPGPDLTPGAEVWRSNTGQSATWTRVATNGFGDNNNRRITLEAFGGQLYAGTSNWWTGGEVWRTGEGTTWIQANVDEFDSDANESAEALEAFNGRLYVGTFNHHTGGEIWRTTDGWSWEQVAGGGFNNPHNFLISSLIAFENALYAFADNMDTGPEVWWSATGDGGSWRKLTDTGFGCGAAVALNWASIAAVFDGKLFAATAARGGSGGCRVWELQPYRYLYLPVTMRLHP